MGIADWKRGYGSEIADCIDGSLFNTHRNVQVDAILLEAESDPRCLVICRVPDDYARS